MHGQMIFQDENFNGHAWEARLCVCSPINRNAITFDDKLHGVQSTSSQKSQKHIFLRGSI